MTVVKNVTNEFGKIITIDVSTGVLREDRREIGPMIQVEIVGPDSQSSNLITPLEAAAVRDALIQELWPEKTRHAAGWSSMQLSPFQDKERLEAIILRLVETTGLDRSIVLWLIGAVYEAMKHFKMMVLMSPEATGYLTSPKVVYGNMPAEYGPNFGQTFLRPDEMPSTAPSLFERDPDQDITDPRV